MKLYVWSQYWLGLRRPEQILTISAYAQRSILESFAYLSQRISYAYHGVPELYEKSYQTDPQLAKRRGILMLGGDSQQKNPVNMIKAWSRLPAELQAAHPLTIAGSTGKASSPIAKALAQWDVNQQVQVHGWVTDQQLVELFQTSRVFLFASREEGFGFPLLQAMSIGTPVVTSKADVLLEIGQDAVCSADAEQPEQLAKQLEALLTDDQLWQQCRAKGKQHAEQFSWEVTARTVADLYRSTLKQ